MTAPMVPQGPPPLPPKPWSPFTRLANDDEPEVAAIRMRRLSRLMATARFAAQPAEWQQLVVEEYNFARAAVAQVMSGAAPQGDKAEAGYSAFEQKTAGLVKNTMASTIAKAVSGQMGANQGGA